MNVIVGGAAMLTDKAFAVPRPATSGELARLTEAYYATHEAGHRGF
jgi:hypothetical protein